MWGLEVYGSYVNGPVEVFSPRSRAAVENWIYANVGAATAVWDEESHICRVFLDKNQTI